ncbi:MAG: polysaccharide deacetylase, partial [Clostridia bacterium]|nr:polysaccharide deacetylase [Clostridia bacterium]
IEEKDKQIEDLKKENLELAAKKEAAAKVPASSSTPSAPTTPSTPATQYTNEELQALISSMTVPKPEQKPLKDHVCYLTFDDGPSTNVTPLILDILKSQNVKATFFVVGTGNLSLLSRISSDGHTIGLHTDTHRCYEQNSNNIYSSTYKYLLDLKAVSDKVQSLTGKRSTVIRFPGGGSNLVSKKVCPGIMSNLSVLVQDMGYSYFDWNVSSGDANATNPTPQQILSNIINNSHVANGEGICVLMHDTNAKMTTAQALTGVITELKKRGYTFEALSPGDFGFHHAVAN